MEAGGAAGADREVLSLGAFWRQHEDFVAHLTEGFGQIVDDTL